MTLLPYRCDESGSVLRCDLCCSQGRSHATAVLAGDVSVCGTISASIVRRASCKMCYPDCALERLQNGPFKATCMWAQSKCHACELETSSYSSYIYMVDRL